MQGQQVFGMGMEYASGEPFYASGHQILYNLCRPHGEFVERLPSMRRGRHSLGDVQHTCQLSSWWRKELLWQSALESHDDKGVWAALLLPTSASDGWKNLSHFLHTCNLSAYPLLRAVCNILESISTTEPRVTVASAKAQAAAAARCRSYDKDEEDTPGFWTGQTVEDSSIESRNGYALWCVDAVAMAKVVQRVVDDLILGSGQELTDASSCSSTKWMTLVQKNGRIDLKKEDTVHWMSAHCPGGTQWATAWWWHWLGCWCHRMCSWRPSSSRPRKLILMRGTNVRRQRLRRAPKSVQYLNPYPAVICSWTARAWNWKS